MRVPLRLVYRALAGACGDQARHLVHLQKHNDRLGPCGDKAEGRENLRRRLLRLADRLSARVGEREYYQGKSLDSRVFGLLVAFSYGHGAAYPEILALCDDPDRARLERCEKYDLPALVEVLARHDPAKA